MKVLSVVGARPQFVKLGPVHHALIAAGAEHVIVHTGQHYDPNLSDVFFADLDIPKPDVHLGVGSGTHGVQTGSMLEQMDAVLTEHRPDWTLVYGDTNSTIAGALSAVKLHFPIAHLEAGLRSFNREMPEEINRVLTDHASDLLLAPTEVAMGHLRDEGLGERSVMVGDVMTDVCLRTKELVADAELPFSSDIPTADGYVVATIHRPANTDDAERLGAVIETLRNIELPVVLLAHPRLVAKAAEHGIELSGGSLHTTEPLAYPQMVRAVATAAGVVTDSGGLQKEAFLLGTPCTTVRTETEWTETLEGGWNILDPGLSNVVASATRPRPTSERGTPYGDGQASVRVVAELQKHLN